MIWFALAMLEATAISNPVTVGLKFDAIVASDGTGTYTNIQSAVATITDHGTNWFNILVKPGIYGGQIIIPKGKSHIRIVGEEMENTVFTWPYNVSDRKSVSTVPFDPGMVIEGNDFCMENLTIENSTGDRGQALALMANGDRASFNHCRILGWQDTLMINNGRDYFTNCYIAGRVDFIYGSATAVFDHCEIHSRNGGHVTAASTPPEKPFGFAFLDCKLTGDSMPWVNPTNKTTTTNFTKKAFADLGRPWRAYANVTYIRCEMGNHIKPEGWNNWRNPTNELTARFAEYQSTGPGANPTARVKWAKQLTFDEAKMITPADILRGSDGWSPSP